MRESYVLCTTVLFQEHLFLFRHACIGAWKRKLHAKTRMTETKDRDRAHTCFGVQFCLRSQRIRDPTKLMTYTLSLNPAISHVLNNIITRSTTSLSCMDPDSQLRVWLGNHGLSQYVNGIVQCG